MNKALAQQIHRLEKQRHEQESLAGRIMPLSSRSASDNEILPPAKDFSTLKRAKQVQQESIFDVPSAPPKQAKPRDTKHYRIPDNSRAKACQFCKAEIYQVEVETDKWYPLEPDPARPGHGTNHWITCPKRKEARAHFDKERKARGRLK